MAQPLEANFTDDLDLPDGYQIVWAAIDPTSGADVSGVTVSAVSIFGTMLDAGGVTQPIVGPFMLVPGPNA